MVAKRKKHRGTTNEITFDGICLHLEEALGGTTRQEILAEVSKSTNAAKSLTRLRACMRSHTFKSATGQLDLDRGLREFNSRTEEDGFHVLHDWDGKAEEFNKEIIPVEVVSYFMRTPGGGHTGKTPLAILLDYYFMYVLALLILRVWDEGDADENLDRLDRLLRNLQGPNGSGQKFADNAETLIFIATSHFEYDESAYDRLLEKVRTLNQAHQVKLALVHAGILGSHLRFGLEASYGKDIGAMRDDNVPDYPWLCFAVSTLTKAYASMHDADIHGVEREKVVEGILNGLSPDARAFVGKPPASLARYEGERSECAELLGRYRQDLFEEFKQQRPSPQVYSPISFFFNFPHNLVKGMVVDALARGKPWDLALNDLLTGIPRDEEKGKARTALARTLMGYARSSPDTIRGRPVPAVVYDPRAGLRDFVKTVRIIKEHTADREGRA